MTSRDFCFWLQGFFELKDDEGHGNTISSKQAIQIRNHLALVFKHEIDPSMGPSSHQNALNDIHNLGKPNAANPNELLRC